MFVLRYNKVKVLPCSKSSQIWNCLTSLEKYHGKKRLHGKSFCGSQRSSPMNHKILTRRAASHMSDPENKGQKTSGVNFDTLGSWNNKLTLPILYTQSIKKGKVIPRVPIDTVAVGSVIGRRDHNEDRYVKEELASELLYFGVFDGHGGSFASDYVSEHLIDHLGFWVTQTDDLMAVLRNAFCDAHNLLARHLLYYHSHEDSFKSGTTATVCLLRDSTELSVGHVGDSICILCREGKPVRLSVDHDPQNNDESIRIIKRGGRIIQNSQGVAHVNGRLAMTRSIGDVELKSFGVTVHPQLRSIEIKHGKDAFLVMGSDGLSFAISDKEIVNIVSSCETTQEACHRLLDQAQHFGSEDNVTVIVIPLGAWGKYQNASSHHNFPLGRILAHSKIY